MTMSQRSAPYSLSNLLQPSFITRPHWTLCGLLVLLNALLLQSCASPGERVDKIARAQQLEKKLVDTNDFQITAYIAGNIGFADKVHVYIEGDGSPWINRTLPAADPTPRNPLMLRLMNYDTGPRIYIGRPCYLRTNDDNRCTKDMWTDARYSELVVKNMIQAINSLTAPEQRLTLLGHSGGGTLAAIIASRIKKVDTIITIAANLDTDAWTNRHHYRPLINSINPINLPPLPASIKQIHIAGSKDKIISQADIRRFVEKQPNARFLLYKKLDHSCCWENIWPEIYRRFLQQ